MRFLRAIGNVIRRGRIRRDNQEDTMQWFRHVLMMEVIREL